MIAIRFQFLICLWSRHKYHPQLFIVSCADAYRGDGIDHAIGDLILAHVLDHIKLSCSLFGDDLVGDFLQFRVELLKKIFKQQRKELEKDRDRIKHFD